MNETPSKETWKTSTKRRLVYVSLILVSLLSGLLLMFFVQNGGFAGNIDKNYFTSVHYWLDTYDEEVNMIFENPSPRNDAVWVDPDQVEVKIDTSLDGTAISATPKFSERFFGEFVFYDARSVTVWVQTETDKQIWEDYIIQVRVLQINMQNRTDPPRHVLP